MKQLFYLLMVICMSFSNSADAQILKKISKQAEKTAEKAVLKKTDQKVNKETNKAMDSLLNEKGEAPVKTVNTDPQTGQSTAPATAETISGKELKTWSKYNFVPGEVIIFQDDLVREENGEFPSR